MLEGEKEGRGRTRGGRGRMTLGDFFRKGRKEGRGEINGGRKIG